MASLKDIVQNCTKCVLHQQRILTVVGQGNPETATVLFIGEAPGKNEDKQGRPFIGQAGILWKNILNEIQFPYKDVAYVTNVIKCRPPNNRNPTQEEIKICSFYLNKQIDIIKPKIICCLGNFASDYILKKFDLKDKIQGISKIHGQVFNASTLIGTIKIIPLYHPAVATYNYNMLETLKKDFKKIK